VAKRCAPDMARQVDAAATRQRILTASGELMRRHGYAGTGIKAILTASGVPYGSLYYHFPGGKEQVGVETLRQAGEAYLALVDVLLPSGDDLPAAVREAFAGAAELVASTDYADACPVATIAGEIASTIEPMRVAAAEAFASWIDLIELRLGEAGVGAERAHDVAVELFCLLEGAFLLARTTRDVTPLHITGRTAETIVRSALAVGTEAERRRELREERSAARAPS
jgi:TetR/AcrR family transcriptional regulator, lmrAB and yxaGH operons repressor